MLFFYYFTILVTSGNLLDNYLPDSQNAQLLIQFLYQFYCSILIALSSLLNDTEFQLFILGKISYLSITT